MEREIYLINFDPEKPFVSTSLPIPLEKGSPLTRMAYKEILNAGYFEEIKDPISGNVISLQFYKNINPDKIIKETKLFFDDFFDTLEAIDQKIMSFRLKLYTKWSSHIFINDDTEIEVFEILYNDFKTAIYNILETLEEAPIQNNSRIIPLEK